MMSSKPWRRGWGGVTSLRIDFRVHKEETAVKDLFTDHRQGNQHAGTVIIVKINILEQLPVLCHIKSTIHSSSFLLVEYHVTMMSEKALFSYFGRNTPALTQQGPLLLL